MVCYNWNNSMQMKIFYFNEDSSNKVFNYAEMGIVNTDLFKIDLDINFAEDDPDNVILIRILP